MQKVVVIGVAWLALLGCGGGDTAPTRADRPEAEGGQAAAAETTRPGGAPRVEEPYQERIDQAWEKALAGENPAATCAGVRGRAAATGARPASRALAACDVDILVRYVLTHVQRVETGQRNCTELMTEIMTNLPTLMISMQGLEAVARGARETSASDGAAAAAAAALLGDAASTGRADNPQGAVLERVRGPLAAACPGEARVIVPARSAERTADTREPSPAYLQGEWCFRRESGGGESGMIVFEADGTNRTALVRVGDEYRFEKPETLARFRRSYPSIVDIEPDRFVGLLSNAHRVVFERGPCR